MMKSLLFILVLAFTFSLVKAEDNAVTIKEINGIDASKDTTFALMLGTKINVKATYNNVDSVTSVVVALVNSGEGWAGPWSGTDYIVDTITGNIDIMLPVKSNFPLYNTPEGKNTIQFVQVKVRYKSGLVNPYKLVRVTKESEMDKVVITQVGNFILPDTTAAKEVAKADALPVKAYYTNPESVKSIQVALTSSTNWATDWKGTSVTIEPPFDGTIDTELTIPEDYPIYNFPEGKNNVQYVQVKVTYDNASGLVQPYELVRVTGEEIIVESIEDYLTSLHVTINEDTTKYMHSGWTVVGDKTTGDYFHFKGTYEAQKNGNKATKVTLGILDFKGDWTGQNFGYSTVVASEEQNNLNGIIDYKVRIPHFYPAEFLVAEATKGTSHQLAQIRVTYNDDVQAPIQGGIYSNFWMDILENTNKPSTCMDVSGITLTDISNSTVKIDWNLGNDAGWDILVAEAGTVRNPDASEDFISVGAKPYVVSGLKAGTDYEVYIRTVCNNDTLNYQAGAYSEKMSFKTTGTVSAWSMDETTFSVYPNPVDNVINISADKTYKVQIVDITGRTVLSRFMESNVEVLGVENLKSGLYIINLSGNGKMMSRKFIKN